jgi:hypothetical protein
VYVRSVKAIQGEVMPSITVTINTPASGPFQLSKLFAGNNYAGAVTIAPASPNKTQSKPGFISVQGDPANTTNFAIVGDSTITPTAGGKRLAAGILASYQGPDTPRLAELFVNGSVATVIVNIEAWGGKQ